MSNIFLLGPQGSGKDTQAALLHQAVPEIIPLRMSGIINHYLETEPEFLGEEAERMANGELYSDEMINNCLSRFIKEQPLFPIPHSSPITLNGVPRRKTQAELVCQTLPRVRKRPIKHNSVAFLFDLDLHIAYDRCLQRAEDDEKKGQRRPDDTPDKIRNRLADHFREEELIHLVLEQKGVKCIHIDASRSKAEVHRSVMDFFM